MFKRNYMHSGPVGNGFALNGGFCDVSGCVRLHEAVLAGPGRVHGIFHLKAVAVSSFVSAVDMSVVGMTAL